MRRGYTVLTITIIFCGCISNGAPDASTTQSTPITGITKVPQSVDDCDSYIDNGERDGCYWTFGVELNNLTICDKIIGQNTKDWCYSGVGVHLKNSTICDMIQTKDAKTQCID